MGCGDLPFGPQGVGSMAFKQQSLLGHLQNHQPHQLAQIQTTDQLLKTDREICYYYKVLSMYVLLRLGTITLNHYYVPYIYYFVLFL